MFTQIKSIVFAQMCTEFTILTANSFGICLSGVSPCIKLLKNLHPIEAREVQFVTKSVTNWHAKRFHYSYNHHYD